MERIGKYQITAKIGTGGFGTVYKAVDPFIKRTVAIKTCTAEDPETQQRFLREAEIGGNLHHRNIVTVYEFGYEGQTPYLVQEYLSGEDLDQKIKRRDSIPLAQRILWLVQIARGLAYAHARGVIHRDVKPSNVRILEDGTVKILDFGIAKLLRSPSNLTQAGVTLGTAAYLAPEQIRGEPSDARTDVFSFGVLAYELLSYQRPFQAAEIPAILYKILNTEPVNLERLVPECPPQLVGIVHRCLSKNPEARFSPTDTLVAALEGAARSQSPSLVDSLVTPKETFHVPTPTTTQPVETQSSTRSHRQPQPPEETLPPTTRIELQNVELLSPQVVVQPRSAGMTTVALKRKSSVRRWLLSGATALGLFTLGGFLTFWVRNAEKPPLPLAATSLESAGAQAPAPAAPSNPSPELSQPPPPTLEAPTLLPPEPQPTPEPPPPQPGKLVFAAGWGPGLSAWVAGKELPLDRERTVELAPGTYSVRFRLVTPDYSFEEKVRVQLEEGQTRRLANPLPPPGKLTIQAHLETPPGMVSVDGVTLGSSPIRGKWLLAGSHRVEIYPSSPEPSSVPIRETVSVASGQETVVTFDLSGSRPLQVRQRPLPGS